MDAETPTRSIKVKFAPRKLPCKKCGTFARRKRIRTRKVRSLAFKETLWLDIHYGEYITNCDCCVSFHSCPEGIDPKAKYDHKVRQAVIDRILERQAQSGYDPSSYDARLLAEAINRLSLRRVRFCDSSVRWQCLSSQGPQRVFRYPLCGRDSSWMRFAKYEDVSSLSVSRRGADDHQNAADLGCASSRNNVSKQINYFDVAI